MSDGVNVATQQTDDGLIAQVSGEISFTATPQFRALLGAVLEQKPGRLVIDLADVPYMDSSGVATLVETLQIQSRAGGKLVLRNLQPRVKSIFDIARLTDVFRIEDPEQSQ